MTFILQRPVRLLLTTAAILIYLSSPANDQPVPILQNGNVSNDGHARIRWKAAANTVVELQQAEHKDFTDALTIYRGVDNATFISGLKNGIYYFRTRTEDGAWSDPVTLAVKHHSLQLAFILCALGAVVFALTVLIVVKGAFQASTD